MLHLQNVADHSLGKTTKLLCGSAAAGILLRGYIDTEACLHNNKKLEKNQLLCK